MRKFTLLFLFTAFYTLIGHSQVTYVPDDNFEQVLIDLGYDSGSLNDYVPTINISSVTILNIEDKGISDLTGIEDFTALTELRCYTNSLTNLDLSANAQLIFLHCSANNLTSLDVSNNTQLQFLNCSINLISSLNLNQNSLLSNFDASNNQLTGLSIKNGTGNIITNFNATNNPNLTCIQVDNATYSTNNWTNIDAQTSFSEDCHYGETYVPDDNFEQALIDLGHDSGSLDDYVPTANINTLTSLDVSNKNISDLTGIEDFVALSTLVCSDNNLTSLDTSNNTSLTDLQCNDNSLTNLDLSNNTALINLACTSNSLSSLDVSNNTSLIYLFCSNNSLTSLDVSNNTALVYLYCYSNSLTHLNVNSNTALTQLYCSSNNLGSLNLVNNTSLQILSCTDNELIGINLKNGNNTSIIIFVATSNPNLTCIQVEDEAYSTTNWTDIDPQTSFSEDCHYGETYVPDDNFEQALVDLGYDSGPLDDYVPTANINTITSLDVSNKNISDLTGIEDFLDLTLLVCSDNNLNSLDITSNTALTTVYCSNNSLTSLDVSNNTALSQLYCPNNSLNALDVSNNTALFILNCFGNNLSSLDLSNNGILLNLTCYGNNLNNLDISANTSLTYLACASNNLTRLNVKNGNNTNFSFFSSTNNPDLACIEVDDATYSNTNWTSIDSASSFSEACHYGETYVPDDNFEQALIDLGYDAGALDDYVPTANIESLTALDVSNENISDLTGIEDFVALTTLDISNNTLISFDISNNTLLEDLECQSNNLTTLDISNNVLLETLNCFSNNLTTLDATNNTVIRYFNCFLNDLTVLDFKNGNNTFILDFNATNNPNLTCIQVDDATYSATNWTTGIDATASFSDNCHLTDTYVPDDNFEQALIDLGIDSLGVLDDYVPTSDINTVASLAVNGKNISDLTGIEDFVALTYLNCSSNNLTALNISNNTLLVALDCIYNDILVLDVTNNVALKTLNFRFNELTSLNISNNSALETLHLRGNDLTNINTSNNTALKTLACGVNSIASLDVSNNTALEDLRCANNMLTSLDVSNNTALEDLECSINNLTSLNLSNNTALTSLGCNNNNLTTLDVSINTALAVIRCNDNNLTNLNVKNGNNSNIGVNDFDTTNNPNLTCIDVDDETYSSVIWTNIDAQTSFSQDCSITLSIDSLNKQMFSLYPNPVIGKLTISAQTKGHFSIINVKGQVLKQGVLINGSNTINMSQFEVGLYFLNIKTESSSVLKKVIKK